MSADQASAGKATEESIDHPSLGTTAELPWLFVDLDGTLIPPGQQVSRRNLEAIRAYTSAGGRLSIATGRHPLAIVQLASALGLETPHITGNGSLVTEKGLSRLLFGIADRADAATRELLSRRIPHVHYTVRGLFVQSPDVTGEHVDLLVAVFHDYQPQWSPPTDPESLFKILLFVDAEDEAYDREMRELGGRVGLAATRSSRHFLELISPDSGKGEALSKLVGWTGWPISRTVAVGDGENDLSMFRKAGLSVAVANAVPELRQAADKIVPSSEEDGVAELIGWLLDGGAKQQGVG